MQPGSRLNPFPGLRPFEPDEDYLFFGREKEIDELLRRLRSNRFLSVVGTSGSGKSSLVRCGLIPSLYSGFMLNAGSSWRVATFRPGEDPIGHLAASLNQAGVLGTDGDLADTNRMLLETTLRRSTLGLVDAVRQARIPPSDNLLVIVDQFEELFRFRRSRQIENSRDEAVAFVKLLLEAAAQKEVPVYVVLTMRSDFIGDCMEYPGLPEAVNAGQYLVPRMTRDELRSAITGPVAVGGGAIAPRLVQRLLNDLGDEQDQLPVLQHALMRTWDHWERHRSPIEPTDVADYEAVGTLRQALSLHAEEAYLETGSDTNRKITERLFKALTDTFSDPRGIRRPASVKELAAICEAPEHEVIRVIEVFRQPGRSFLMPPATVTLGSRSIIDLSHESLMRCWTRLVTWTGEEAVQAATYFRLSQAASWFEQGTTGLWRNPELEIGLRWKRREGATAAWAERYDSSFVRAMEFLDRSEQEQARVEAEREQERKRELRHVQWAAVVLGIMLVIAVSLAYVAWNEKHRAEANLKLAKTAVDESLSTAGRRQAREAADTPQMEEFRQELLEKAKDFYVNYLGKQDPGSEKFRVETALTRTRLGDVNRLLGKYQDAVNEYQLAITELESQAKQHPKNPDYRQAWAYACNWLGETLRIWLEGKQKPLRYTRAYAENEYDSALRLQQELVNQIPGNPSYHQELARTYYNRGILRSDNGDLNNSESDFRQAIRLLEPLAAEKAEISAQEGVNVLPSQDLARVYNDLANLLREKKRLSEAREFYEHAIGIGEALTKEKSDNREYKIELATFYNNLAALLWEENDVNLAKQRNHQATDLIEELATPEPQLEGERSKAFMLYGLINQLQHPEFHVTYTHLGDLYVDAARNSLHSGSIADAQDALKSLSRLLPELVEPDRSRLAKAYDDLQREFLEKRVQRK
jgi:tetratricopeptide (TPR) repeat protein/energy-coupling factor transporter ATP-binding protein EcfA2